MTIAGPLRLVADPVAAARWRRAVANDTPLGRRLLRWRIGWLLGESKGRRGDVSAQEYDCRRQFCPVRCGISPHLNHACVGKRRQARGAAVAEDERKEL